MNRSLKKNKKAKAAVPVYFQKCTSSVSDILQTNIYKQRMKELIKNNKELAQYSQNVKIINSHLQQQLEDYAREGTQLMFAKTKIKDMATSITKLVCDLHEVVNCLEKISFNKVPYVRSPSDIRLKVPGPNLSSIDESASGSGIESLRDDTLSRLSLPQASEVSRRGSLASPGISDNSNTELYSVATSLFRTMLGSNKNLHSDSNTNFDDPSGCLPEQTSPGSPIKQSKGTRNRKSSPSNSKPPKLAIPSIYSSKIPKMKHTPPRPQKKPHKDSFEAPSYPGNRRETFVIKPLEAQENMLTTNDRRGTFTIKQLAESLQKQQRRDTYFVSSEPVVSAGNLQDGSNNRETFFVNDSTKLAERQSNRSTFFVPPKEIESIQDKGKLNNQSTFISSKPAQTIENLQDQYSKKDTDFVSCVPEIMTEKLQIENNKKDVDFIFSKPAIASKPVSEMPRSVMQSASLVDCTLANKTVFLYEDMELTEVLPVFKNMKEAGNDIVSTNGMNENVTRNKNILPVFSKDKKIQISIVNKSPLLFHDKNALPSLDGLFNNTPDGLSSADNTNKTEVISSTPSADLNDTEILKVDKTLSSKRSLVKISSLDKGSDVKTSRKSLKGRLSLACSKKSMKKSCRVSDVKGAGRKSKAKTSIAKYLSPTNLPEVLESNELDLDDHSCQRSNRRHRSVNFEKYFADDSFSGPKEDENFVPGRRVINFKEGRKTVNPKKRKFVFALNAESPTIQDTLQNNEIKNMDVFHFSASDEDEPSIKNKKSKKPSKKNFAIFNSQCNAKDKGDEKVAKCLKDSKGSVSSKCSQSEEDSLVIKKLSDGLISPVSRASRETPLRTCKQSLVTGTKSSSLTKEVNEKVSASDDVFSPARASKERVSRKASKTKRTFSGVSERSSKRRTVPNNSLDELDNVALELVSKNVSIPRSDPIDNEGTDIYNCKDMANLASPRSMETQSDIVNNKALKNIEKENIMSKVMEDKAVSKKSLVKISQQISLVAVSKETEFMQVSNLVTQKELQNVKKGKVYNKASHSKDLLLTEKQKIVSEETGCMQASKSTTHETSQKGTQNVLKGKVIIEAPHSKDILLTEKQQIVYEPLVEDKDLQLKVQDTKLDKKASAKLEIKPKKKTKNMKVKVSKDNLKDEQVLKSKSEPEMKKSVIPSENPVIAVSNKQKHAQNVEGDKVGKKSYFHDNLNEIPIDALGEITINSHSPNKIEQAAISKVKANHMKENRGSDDFQPSNHKVYPSEHRNATNTQKTSAKLKPKKQKTKKLDLNKKLSGLSAESDKLSKPCTPEKHSIGVIPQLAALDPTSIENLIGNKDSISSVGSKDSGLPNQFNNCRPRRSKTTTSFKEPRLNTKMRR